MHVIGFNRPLLLVFLLAMQGCASFSGSHDQYFVCSYDTVWDTALETMKGYSITAQSKDKGTIETSWIEMEGKEHADTAVPKSIATLRRAFGV
jgi:uncharacterized lipoprotein